MVYEGFKTVPPCLFRAHLSTLNCIVLGTTIVSDFNQQPKGDEYTLTIEKGSN